MTGGLPVGHATIVEQIGVGDDHHRIEGFVDLLFVGDLRFLQTVQLRIDTAIIKIGDQRGAGGGFADDCTDGIALDRHRGGGCLSG